MVCPNGFHLASFGSFRKVNAESLHFRAEFLESLEGTVKKNEKTEVVAKIRRELDSSEAIFVVTQNRMTVAETEDLRKRLRETAGSYLVCKNTLARIAVTGTRYECVLPQLTGQSAIVFTNNLTGSAKVVQEYASKSDDKVVVVCGEYSGKLLSAADIKTLSQLPSMDELRAKIIAVIQTPAQRIATLSQAPASQIARVLKAYSEK